jgi:photosystem II stability/assembly factor-like uncharacterized protein
MKKVSLVIAIFLLASSNCFSQWIAQNSGTIYAIKSVDFTDVNTGYACAYNTVLKTTNSGLNWLSSTLQGTHNKIVFVNSATGFICGDSGRIFKTTNSGGNWIPVNSGVTNHLQSLSFLNAQTGIASGLGKTVIKTTDGGVSWFSIANFVWQVGFLSSFILNADKYFISGENTFIMKTTNAGQSWTEYTHGDPNPLFTIYFLNENTGWSTGCCGMFMTTTNGGVNWSYMYYLSQGYTFHSMQFINQMTGYVAGDNGMIYRTTNGALWWDSTLTGTNQTIFSLKMVYETTGWAAGGYGTILKTTNGGGPGFTIGINAISNEVPAAFELSQNYPNPFNPQTKIKFTVPHQGYVKIRIFNSTGKELEILYSGNLNAGYYESNFDAVKYPSGVYFCRAEFDGAAVTKKMILLK